MRVTQGFPEGDDRRRQQGMAVESVKVDGREEGTSNEMMNRDMAGCWRRAKVCQELGVVLQEWRSFNGFDEIVLVVFSFTESVVALGMVLYHATQLSLTGYQLSGRVIPPRGFEAEFVCLIACARNVCRLSKLRKPLLVFVSTALSEIPRSPLEEAQHRKGTQKEAYSSNRDADGDDISLCRPC